MRRNILMMAVAIGVAASSLATARADDDTEARLRDALRTATSQLRQLQDDQVTQQAREAELQKQNDTLRAQVAQLQQQNGQQPGGKGGKLDQAALDQAVAEFNKKLAAQNAAISEMNGNLDKWRAAYNQAATVARAKEAERAQLATKVEGLSKDASSCTAKNGALVKVANEILDRYQRMDVGDAIGNREPFIGVERVKLQNIVQDYQDKIQDQTVALPTAP
jgi:chromosome segregation ATPase